MVQVRRMIPLAALIAALTISTVFCAPNQNAAAPVSRGYVQPAVRQSQQQQQQQQQKQQQDAGRARYGNQIPSYQQQTLPAAPARLVASPPAASGPAARNRVVTSAAPAPARTPVVKVIPPWLMPKLPVVKSDPAPDEVPIEELNKPDAPSATLEQKAMKHRLLDLASKVLQNSPDYHDNVVLYKYDKDSDSYEPFEMDPNTNMYREKLRDALLTLSAKRISTNKLRKVLYDEDVGDDPSDNGGDDVTFQSGEPAADELEGPTPEDELKLKLKSDPARLDMVAQVKADLDDRLNRLSDLLFFRPEFLNQLVRVDDATELTPVESQFKRLVLCMSDDSYCNADLSAVADETLAADASALAPAEESEPEPATVPDFVEGQPDPAPAPAPVRPRLPVFLPPISPIPPPADPAPEPEPESEPESEPSPPAPLFPHPRFPQFPRFPTYQQDPAFQAGEPGDNDYEHESNDVFHQRQSRESARNGMRMHQRGENYSGMSSYSRSFNLQPQPAPAPAPAADPAPASAPAAPTVQAPAPARRPAAAAQATASASSSGSGSGSATASAAASASAPTVSKARPLGNVPAPRILSLSGAPNAKWAY